MVLAAAAFSEYAGGQDGWLNFDIDNTPGQRLRINPTGEKEKPFSRRDDEAGRCQLFYVLIQRPGYIRFNLV